MKPKINLTWQQVTEKARRLAKHIVANHPTTKPYKIFPVLRGGAVPAAVVQGALQQMGRVARIVSKPGEATIFIDDVIDSGATLEVYAEAAPGVPFYALYDKRDQPTDQWVVFPWELADEAAGPTEAVKRIIQAIGEDPDREGLSGTPERVVKSWAEIYGGYHVDVEGLITSFEDGACDEMVVLKDVEFFSNCEHHMLPFFGKAHLAYIPNGKVIGVSKLARILEVFSRRMQIQERIGQQWTQAINEHLDPLGAACILEAKHFCMVCRGVNKQHSTMVTSSLTGAFKTDPSTRNELMLHVKG